MTIRLLTTASAPAIGALVAKTQTHDGLCPLNEQALINLHLENKQLVHLGISQEPSGEENLLGYAQINLADSSVQLLIDPDQRRRGLGRMLVQEIIRNHQPDWWWAFGNLPAASALAARFGLVPKRGLAIMELSGDPAIEPAPLADGYRITHFDPTMTEQLIKVNAAAFAHHPEQGRMDQADFVARFTEQGADPSAILVALHHDQLAGFHWTKSDPGDPKQRGEVYVIAVHPSHEGQGLGRALLKTGIVQLYQRAAKSVILYVEADNERVVKIYQRAGFAVTSTDICYGRSEEGLGEA